MDCHEDVFTEGPRDSSTSVGTLTDWMNVFIITSDKPQMKLHVQCSLYNKEEEKNYC